MVDLLAGLRVLVVDDDDDLGALVRALLVPTPGPDSRAVEVVTAGSLTDGALRLIEEERPDVVLLDLGLPDVPGVTPVAGVAVLASIPDAPPVVAITAAASDRGPDAVAAGACDYLDKTELVQPGRLRRAVCLAVARDRRTRRTASAAEDLGATDQLAQLSGRLRHDLRHPLTTAIAALDTVLQVELDDDAREGLLVMVTERLRELTRRLDDLSGALAAREEPAAPTREELDLRDLADEVRVDLVPWERDRLHVAVHGDGQVWASRRLLRALLGGLVRNALQYNPDADVTIHVEVRIEDGRAVLLVADDGIAIAPELRDAVFDIGWTSDAPALGVGLSAANSAATMMDGAIRAVGSPYGGAAFRVELPQRPMVTTG